MVRYFASVLLSVFVCFALQAQNVNYAEYFWDADPGVGNGTEISITPGELISNISSVETTGLENGFHKLYIRVCDENGACSHYSSFLVLIEEFQAFVVDHAEYFWDTDPGPGQGTPLAVNSGDEISETFVISTEGLNPGYHYLHIRARDENQSWTHYRRILVYIDGFSPVLIQEMEYFWDVDPGAGNGTPIDIESGEVIAGNFEVNSNGLELGDHWLHIRVKDNAGSWSLYHRERVIICTTFSPTADFNFEIDGDSFNFSSNSSFAETLSWQVDGLEQGTESEFSTSPPGEQEVCLIATNECYADTLCLVVGVPLLVSVNPGMVSNDGTQTVTASGYLLNSAASAEIRRDGEIIVSSDLEVEGSNDLTVTFNFSDETLGLWDFVVILDDASELILENGLELVESLHISNLTESDPILFPNPANRYVEISGMRLAEVIVFNLSGAEVLRTSEAKFSVESLAPGMYSVQVTDSDFRTYNLKLVVN